METAQQQPVVQEALAATRPFCLGDCNDDRAVSMDDLLVLVNIALGRADLIDCIPGNRNLDAKITVDDFLSAFNPDFCPM